jgi:hypothetical protein
MIASAIDVVGGVSTSGSAAFHPAPTTGFRSISDPLGGLQPPCPTGLTSYGTLKLSGNAQQTICPGVYSQISASGNAILTMNPGIYIIEGGGFTVTGNASVSGSGVLIYNAGSNFPNSGGNFGGITLSGNGTVNLTAPTSGTYAGILFFQSRQNTRALSFSGNAMGGMTGVIYAQNALLSMSGNAALQNPLDVGMLNLSGNVTLTQMAAGSDGSGDVSGIASTLLAGDLSVYINDPSGLFTSDELARIQDAINTWDALLVPYNVTITEVSDPSLANLVIDTGDTSACGSAADGVLGCFNAPNAEITLLQGWNWYAGSDPSQIGANQYDFETTVLHELGHALGLGGSPDPTSPMYETLAAGVADRMPTTQDLNIPDPPEGADPQMAAGFFPGPVAVPVSPMGPLVSLRSSTDPGPAGAMPATSFQSPVVSVQLNSGGVQKGSQIDQVPSLVVQGADEANELGFSNAGSHGGLVLDAVLEDLVSDVGRVQDEVDPGTSETVPIPGVRDSQDGFRSDHGRPGTWSRPIEMPRVEEGLVWRRLPAVPVFDAVLDEIAAAAVGWNGRTAEGTAELSAPRLRDGSKSAGPADGIGENGSSGEAGGPLARLAVALLAAGLWNHRGKRNRPRIPTRLPRR